METISRKYSVFVVDDSEVLRQNLRKLIDRNPNCYAAGDASNLVDAIVKITESKPDFVILDINFPEGTAIDYIRKIKQLNEHSTIIMFSNFETEKLRKICAEEGADYYFNKSTEIEKLMDFLDNLQ